MPTSTTSPSDISPRERIGFQFVELARRWRRVLDQRLSEVGLTDATWSPLVHLQASGDGIQQKDLALRVGLDGSTLVRLLDILAARGLIERREDGSDRRGKLVFLTPAGHQVVTDIRKVLLRADLEMLADVSDREIAVMRGAFEKIGVRAQAILDARKAQA